MLLEELHDPGRALHHGDLLHLGLAGDHEGVVAQPQSQHQHLPPGRRDVPVHGEDLRWTDAHPGVLPLVNRREPDRGGEKSQLRNGVLRCEIRHVVLEDLPLGITALRQGKPPLRHRGDLHPRQIGILPEEFLVQPPRVFVQQDLGQPVGEFRDPAVLEEHGEDEEGLELAVVLLDVPDLLGRVQGPGLFQLDRGVVLHGVPPGDDPRHLRAGLKHRPLLLRQGFDFKAHERVIPCLS